MPVDMKITGREDVLKASLRIKEHGSPKAVRKELNKSLREAAAPAVADVKEAALSLPSKRSGGGSRDKRGRFTSGGLRQAIASATSAQAKSSGKEPSVKIRISRARMKEKAPVPQLMDRGPFRHKVFGREVWVTQDGHEKWFENAVEKSVPLVRERIKEAANRIEHGMSKH